MSLFEAFIIRKEVRDMQILKSLNNGFAQLSIRTRLVAAALLCGIFVVPLPASSAVAGQDFQYATGVLGVGAYYWTSGFDNRSYNRAWHQPGYTWSVWYADTNGFTSCSVQSNTNPTRCETNGSYKQSWCHNVNDNSDVTWSCNSTHGFALESAPNGFGSSVNPVADSAGRPARDVLTVFRRNRASADRLPLALEFKVDEETQGPVGTPAVAQPGLAITSQSRALLSGLGTHSETLYAVPTSTGGVCMALTSHGALGCVDRFNSKAPYGWEVRDADQMGTGEPAIVTGLVPTSVSSVWIRLGETSEQATVGNGGFFYELKGSEVWPEAIEFRYANGTESVVTVTRPDGAD
jgi:hypothetical protein